MPMMVTMLMMLRNEVILSTTDADLTIRVMPASIHNVQLSRSGILRKIIVVVRSAITP